ncbi:hypothetical protein OG594_05420 [Streptomyces sp. NBC_01214]|uniref:hypothetical protein n=1 Tax=Streptomyces sp. NBC_01214 TaxID=2903777 RepID=UPI002255D0BB|nr:hypothetical protein [Streptomyces sp. NBC_01214]MCX4801101.1 hypothetical protein [Streptomyces sp. NBC_01214]
MGWDPVGELTAEDRELFGSHWERRMWLNVPGPFYTAETDTCWTGRLHAPDNVLYAAACESVEYVFRQPRDAREVRNVVAAAREEVFGEYACDGDLWWTPPAVRQWWAERARVAEHLAGAQTEWRGRNRFEDDALIGVLDFQAHLAGGLAADLRAYLFRLEEGRYPEAGERLPELD